MQLKTLLNFVTEYKSFVFKTVYGVLKSSNAPLNPKEILTIIQRRMEGNDFTEKQIKNATCGLSGRKTDIFLWDHGKVYIHRNNIPTNLSLLTQIEKRLKEMIKKAKTPYIMLYTLYNEFASECKAEGIPSAYALHACLKARNIPGIVFMHSPHVSTSSKKHKRQTVELLAKWIAKQKNTVAYLSLKRHAHEIGLGRQQFLNNLTVMKSVIRYGSGHWVHLDSLDWNQQKQEILLDIAKNYWEHCIENNSLFARTDELLSLHENKLPELANNIAWTPELIFSLLSPSDSIVTFGNTHLAYGFNTVDSSPKSLGDIVIQILRERFDGQAGQKEISSHFRELKVIRSNLLPKMLDDHPGITITNGEIYLSE